MSHRKVAAVIALALTIFTSSCDAGPNNRPPNNDLIVSAPPSADISPSQNADALAFPLDTYRITPQEVQSIVNATQKLVAKCAAGFGIDYPTALSATAVPRDYSRLYGVADLTVARQYGYGTAPVSSDRAQARAQAAAMPPDADTVISGWPRGLAGDPAHPPSGLTYRGQAVPTGGCAGQAAHRLGLGADDNPQDPALVRSVADSANHQAEADPRVVAGFRAWSACMKAAGYTYRTPWDPQDASWPQPTGAAEIDTAVADVTCKQQGNLVGIWYGVEVAYEKALIQRYATGLAEEKKHYDQLVATAAQVLAGT